MTNGFALLLLLLLACGPSERKLQQAKDLGCASGTENGRADGEQDGRNCEEKDEDYTGAEDEQPESCSDIDTTDDELSSNECVAYWLQGYDTCYRTAYRTAYNAAFKDAGCEADSSGIS